jgi:hypothetical protein
MTMCPSLGTQQALRLIARMVPGTPIVHLSDIDGDDTSGPSSAR